ncbi:MAG: anti-sigma factor family protein [Candidatus Saccharicenans sp.]
MISDWLDGQLGARKEKKLFAHLEHCEECRDYFEFQRGMKERLAESRPVENSDEWWAKFEEEIKTNVTQIKENLEGRAPRKVWKYVPALAGSLALLVLVILFLWRIPDGKDADSLIAMTISFEETYLGLSQAVQQNSNLAQQIDDELENSLVEEINKGNVNETNLENYNYYEKEFNYDLTNNIQPENLSMEDLS